MDFLKQNKKWIGLVGCIIVIIGCFLPFAKASLFGISQSTSLIEGGDGWILLIVAVISGILIFLSKYKFSLIPTAIGLIINIYEMTNVSKEGMGIVKLTFAPYLILIGLAIAIACVFIKENK